MRFLFFSFSIFLLSASSLVRGESDSASLAKGLNDAFADVYEKVSPSVVIIELKTLSSSSVFGGSGWMQGWLFSVPPGAMPGTPGREPETISNQGSGLIIRSDGYIATNFHVIEDGDPESIEVILQSGKRLPARIVGVDEKMDLAVLQVEADNLPAAKMADSEKVRVGQFAFALGAPMELPFSFTFGLVSGTGRSNLIRRGGSYEDYIQTDAAINPGNSGGPLCDIDGNVIGINTLISGMSRGLGFAIPSNIVQKVSNQLIEHGRVMRPWLGISIEGIQESEDLRAHFSPIESGVVVHGVFPRTPASQSDLQLGDVIVTVDGKFVVRAADVQKAVFAREVGDKIQLEVWREGTTRKIEIPAGEQPDSLRQVAGLQIPMSPGLPPSPSRFNPPKGVSDSDGEGIFQQLGMEVQDLNPQMTQSLRLNPEAGGVIVTAVKPGSPADAAGLEAGDIITTAGNRRLRSAEALAQLLEQMDRDRGVMLLITRESQKSFRILKP